MSNLCIYMPGHPYEFGDMLYVSWLDQNLYAVDIDDSAGGDGLINGELKADSFYLSITDDANDAATTGVIQYTSTITEGYVRETEVSATSTTITGLDHLDGESVTLVRNGEYIGMYSVVSGSITVPSAIYSSYSVGLPYTMRIKTMRLEVPQANTLQTRIKNINEASVRHVKTTGGQAGQETEGTTFLNDLNCTFSNQSADKQVNVRGGFGEDGYIVVESSTPTPMTVLATIVSLTVHENR